MVITSFGKNWSFSRAAAEKARFGSGVGLSKFVFSQVFV